MQRRELFTGVGKRLKAEKKPIAPPYLTGSLSECLDCDAPCVVVCETDILSKNEEGFVEVSFVSQGCTYCDECATACVKGVLSVESKAKIPVDVYIDEVLCVSYHGVMCMSCKDPCLEDAINFAGLFKPIINPISCTSCGFCISRCPAAAIKVI